MIRKTSLLTSTHQQFCFFTEEKGTTLIEFGLLGSIFILLTFGILQIAFTTFVKNTLDAAVREAGRYGVTGQSISGQTRQQSITQVIKQTCNLYSGGMIDPNKLTITVKAYPDLTQINSTTSGTAGSFGTAGQAVLYKVSYTWDTLFALFGTNNLIVVQAQSPVVNELFSSNS